MSKIAALRDLVVALLLEHERDGTIPTNARFLFYELVQRGQISKEKTGVRQRSDQNLHDALTDVREDGRIPWDWISTKRDRWRTTPLFLYSQRCACKATLRPARPVARYKRPAWHRERIPRPYSLDQWPVRLRTDIAQQLQPGGMRVLYLGDFDLSGDLIETNTRRDVHCEPAPDSATASAMRVCLNRVAAAASP